ncbi:chromosomal replication initiator protein DnaA, partial [Francisella tularensis subsp. holarctica]|nr:chromosomal replication initiator protein DnaA [Francisella tularensis subsp. holarctica]
GEKITEVITSGPQANIFSTTSVEIKDESEDTKVEQEPKISKKSNSKEFSSSQELFGFDEAMLITAKEYEEYSFGLPLKE